MICYVFLVPVISLIFKAQLALSSKVYFLLLTCEDNQIDFFTISVGIQTDSF